MRKFISITMALMLFFSFPVEAFAAGENEVAVPSNTSFIMNGKNITFDNAYGIEGTNYIQLRSVAKLLSGTNSQFNVYWDEKIGQAVIETGAAYTGTKPIISEQKAFGVGDKVSMNGVDITITNAFTSKTAPGGFVSGPGEVFYAVSFTILTSNQPEKQEFWWPVYFISHIATVKGTEKDDFFITEGKEIYPNKLTDVTIYYTIKETDQIASITVQDLQDTSRTILLY